MSTKMVPLFLSFNPPFPLFLFFFFLFKYNLDIQNYRTHQEDIPNVVMPDDVLRTEEGYTQVSRITTKFKDNLI